MKTPDTRRPAMTDPWTWIFLLGAFGHLANGFWMLADPVGWYTTLPAAVPDFGPLNEHFVRDLGSTFTMLGLGLLWGTFRRAVRVPVLALVTLFSALHALVHVYDTARGLVGPLLVDEEERRVVVRLVELVQRAARLGAGGGGERRQRGEEARDGGRVELDTSEDGEHGRDLRRSRGAAARTY